MITQENIPYTADEIKEMVKTCEKYNKALERASKLRVQNPFDTVGQMVEYIFPELRETEDESMRKALYADIRTYIPNERGDKYIAWLEKQREQKTAVYVPKFRVGDIVKSKSRPMLDARKIISIDKDCYWCEDGRCLGFAWEYDYELVEQKSTDKTESFKASDWYVSKVDGKIHNIYQSVDKAEPKFKAGDWIVDNKTPNDVFCVIEVLEEIYKVIDVDGDDYHIPHCKADKQFHIWTIDDAKDGDALVDEDNNIGLYLREKDDSDWHSCIYLGCDNCLRAFSIGGYHKHKNTKPATKEQRDLLFQKMKDAGIWWDAEKKELKKMEVSSKESDDEKIVDELKGILAATVMPKQRKREIFAWVEKQEQGPKKVSIWKHWENGIAGNGNGEQKYLIRTGNTYNLSSVLGFECDYIELENLI